MAIVTLFWNRDLGFGMTEIMLLQAIFGVAVAVLEFPSGYLADRIGYRSALLLGALASIAGWTAHASATSFWTVATAEVLLGAGLSLISGADTALGALVAWRLVEPARRRPPIGDHLARVAAIVRHVARENAPLRAVVFATTVFSTTTFVPVWLIALCAAAVGVPVAWLGPIWAAANYTVALGSLASAGLGRRLGTAPALLACTALAAAGYAGLGLAHLLFGFAFYFAITLARGLAGSVLHHAEQRLIPGEDRASFLSLRSLLFRATFLVVGPVVGAGVDRFGQRPVILLAGAVLCPLSLAGCLWLGHAIRPSSPGG
jgi:predicted MFS family arabinose efflux permease